jgi:hypothetical protein
MRAGLLAFMLSIAVVQLSAQSATTVENPEHPIPQNSPCASQPRSLSELTASFKKGRAPSAQELKGTWIEIGSFNYGMLPPDDELQRDDLQSPSRSLNCTGIMRGNQFEFAMIGVDYDWVMEFHVAGSGGGVRNRLESNHRGSVEFSFCRDGDCSGRVLYDCRLTNRGTLACIGGDGGAEFRKMKVESRKLSGGN